MDSEECVLVNRAVVAAPSEGGQVSQEVNRCPSRENRGAGTKPAESQANSLRRLQPMGSSSLGGSLGPGCSVPLTTVSIPGPAPVSLWPAAVAAGSGLAAVTSEHGNTWPAHGP